jgi:ferritin-like metal-binding protein YciE
MQKKLFTTSKNGTAVKSAKATKSTTVSKTKSIQKGMQASQLMQLLEDQLKDIFWAEKAISKALPKMIKKASSTELEKGLSKHLSETEAQITRLTAIFELMDKKAVAKKCEAMAGLITESIEIMAACESGAMRDAGIISASQKMYHYQIATYGTMRQFAETLGIKKVQALLLLTLIEEKAADLLLTDLATRVINIEAAEAVA